MTQEHAGILPAPPAAPAAAAPAAPPATIVIFGAFGDLTSRLLVPALANLAQDGLLSAGSTLIGVDHSPGDDAAFSRRLRKYVPQAAAWDKIRAGTQYLRGDFTKPATYAALKRRVAGNALFYLATFPDFFGPIVDELGKAGLLDEATGFRRIVIEKPFGHDTASAQALNARILTRAGEAQIFRIDHFLGKETVQNLMVARFGNVLIEALWNNHYIDHIQITAAETVGVGTRGKFYDGTGAVRDMVPNHMLQLFALVAMEPPNDFSADAVHREKTKALMGIAPITPDNAARGRYGAGMIGGEPVKAYVDEANVAAGGTTETYVALKLGIENWRWAGVPFYLRTGKALAARDTEIVVVFRDIPAGPFRSTDVVGPPPNRLIFQIQPEEGISMGFIAKRPGPLVTVAPVAMNFRYADAFDLGPRTGYETLLYDVLIGDQSLFQRAEQIEAGWRAIQPLLDAWAGPSPPETYPAGGTGPESAAALIARDGRIWHPLGR